MSMSRVTHASPTLRNKVRLAESLTRHDTGPVDFWYSPGFILEAADAAVTYCTENAVKSTSALSKILGEARASAFFALSVAQQRSTETWLQFVDQREQAPDMRVMHFEMVGKLQTMTTINVEVASYTRHSDEDLGDFMLRTKLKPEVAYSKDTVIVFFVQRAIGADEVRRAHEIVSPATIDTLAFLVGQADWDLFQVQMVYPRLAGRIDTRISDALASQHLIVAEVKRGMSTEAFTSPALVPTENPFLAYVQPT